MNKYISGRELIYDEKWEIHGKIKCGFCGSKMLQRTKTGHCETKKCNDDYYQFMDDVANGY